MVCRQEHCVFNKIVGDVFYPYLPISISVSKSIYQRLQNALTFSCLNKHIIHFHLPQSIPMELSEIDSGIRTRKKWNHDCKCFLLLTFIQCCHVMTFENDSFPYPKLIRCPLFDLSLSLQWDPILRRTNSQMCPEVLLVGLLVWGWQRQHFQPKLLSSSRKVSRAWSQRPFCRKEVLAMHPGLTRVAVAIWVHIHSVTSMASTCPTINRGLKCHLRDSVKHVKSRVRGSFKPWKAWYFFPWLFFFILVGQLLPRCAFSVAWKRQM